MYTLMVTYSVCKENPEFSRDMLLSKNSEFFFHTLYSWRKLFVLFLISIDFKSTFVANH